ncbi:alpha-ketoglutarate-dependent dioxygenase AlkB [Legionella sp. PC997]|uniref:alpha-ketoglutarate-dependent dioxygenase AlkB n=1 Tax=Legionella sp. PC997 TaxID=2755562 RepID=UPI0015FA48A7|nr:alpha-ketoglutarate-dependent dioxygenase AlkB [Legionella sp. PC997]QMT60533.1 hypothetical protein HBNCFIEN_01906 [Legionella sp. PC997]
MNNLVGFSFEPDFLTPQEEAKLLQNIQELRWQQVALFGQIAKRRVVHFGMDYHYERRTVKKAEPIPAFLNEIKIRSAGLLKVHPDKIAEVLITEYPINAGIGWHRDAAVFETICGISLNSSTLIHFRKRKEHKEHYKLLLNPGSAYTLDGDIRWNWEHRIAPVKQLRYSITFRTLKVSVD